MKKETREKYEKKSDNKKVQVELKGRAGVNY